MNADEIIGERVHVLLRRNRISQERFGQAIGLTQAAAGKKLLGQRSWTIDEILATARFLEVEVTEILPGNEYAPVLAGRGRIAVDVRPKRLELPTFCMGVKEWTVDDDVALMLFAASERVNGDR